MTEPTDYSKLKVADLKVRAPPSLLVLTSSPSSSPPHQPDTHPRPLPQDLLKDRQLPVSGLKADLVARLAEDDQAAPAIPEPLSASADDSAPAPQQLQDAAHPAPPDPEQQAVGGMGDQPPPLDTVNLPAKRQLEDAVVDEETKRIRTNATIADQVPPAGSRDAGTAAGEPVQVRSAPAFESAPDLAQVAGDGPNLSVVAESKVPTEDLVKSANGELPPAQDGAAAVGEVEQDDEEEEPPVYEFEPEEESARPADLYLDTVRPLVHSSRRRSRRD